MKFVITYNYCDWRDIGDKVKLEFVSEWMQKLSVYDKDTEEELLIIIGNCAPRNKENDTYDLFDYRGYSFEAKTGSFKIII